MKKKPIEYVVIALLFLFSIICIYPLVYLLF